MNTTTLRWPAFIIALVLAFVVISWWSFDRAFSRVSPVSDPHYYSHGLKYNSSNIELQAAQALQWTVTPTVQGRVLSLRVTDAGQGAVTGGHGSIALQSDGQGQAETLPLTESGQGLYTVSIPAGLPATLTASLTLSREQARVQRRLLISL